MAEVSYGFVHQGHSLYELILKGDFTGRDKEIFLRSLGELEYKRAQHIALNCSKITFIHRDGILLLYEERKRLASNHCQLYLVELSNSVQVRISRMGLALIFQERPCLGSLIQELDHAHHPP